MKKNLFVGMSLCILFFLLISCSKEGNDKNFMDNVTFTLEEKDINLDTEVSYTIKMTNDSDYTIVQNTVLFSFIMEPINSGLTTDPFKLITEGNQLNIKPGESIDLTVSLPSDLYKEFKQPEVKKANLYINGYFDKLTEDNHFDFVKSIDLK